MSEVPTRGIIDVHHHMFPPTVTRALRAGGVEALAGAPLPADWSPDVSLQVMEKYAIDAAILSVPVPLDVIDRGGRHRVAREVNEFGHQVAEKSRGRLGFFASLPLPDPGRSIDEARYALDQLGADGVALLTNHAGIYQGDDRLDPLYAELDEREAVCFVHPTVPVDPGGTLATGGSPLPAVQPSVLEFPFDITRAIANVLLTDTIHKFPRLRFIFTHCGGCVSSLANRLIDRRPLIRAYTEPARNGRPPAIEQVEGLMEDAQDKARNDLATLHFDIALSSDAQALGALTNLVPVDQLLVGTDFPMAQEIGVRATLAGVERFSGFSGRDRSALHRRNAARLFPRLAGDVAR